MGGIRVVGKSNSATGVVGISYGNSISVVGVSGLNQVGGIGILGSGNPAGPFNGYVEVTGDIKLLNPQNADCAEDFDIIEQNVEPEQ